MKIIELDLSGCKYLAEVHERIRVAFDFPEWYGKNWNAFWDLLRSECDADKLVVKGENTLTKEFDEQITIFHETLDEYIEFREKYKKYGLNAFEYEIVG